MNRLVTATLLCLLALPVFAQKSDTNELNMNGMASFEQLRKEYFIGALYLGWPGHDPATITNMPGKKRMELRITADRWPSLRFAQTWNQLILINNEGSTLNANVMDVISFTNIPKGDLVEGDQLAIELETDKATVVSLNGTTMLRTNNPALFNMLLNVWIGARPPTSEFKRDILTMPKDKAGTDLLARYDALRPADGRKKVAIGWGGKVEQEAPPAVAEAPKPAPAPEPVKVKRPETVAVAAPRPEPEVAKAEPKPEVRPKAEPKPEPKPEPREEAPAPVPVPVKKPVVAEVPKAAPPAAAPQVDTATLAMAQKAKQEREAQQQDLYNDYLIQIRRQVNHKTEYPRRAVKEAIEGLVVLRVKVDRSGNLLGTELAQSADDMLDKAAVTAVQGAAPFPPAVAQLEGAQFQFLVPIVFKLTK